MSSSRDFWIKLPIVLATTFVSTNVLAFTETNNLPRPEWIQAIGNSAAQPIVFRKQFASSPDLLRAILLVAGDGQLSVTLNGASVANSDNRAHATAADVRTSLKNDDNVLEVRATNPGGPVTFGCLFELASPNGKIDWIVSDTNWIAMAASNPSPLALRSLGRTDANPRENPFDTREAFDAYNSWKLAKGTNTATPAESLTLLPGFRAELLRSAQPGEDSWIALAFDPQGRLTIAKEKRGLLRLSLGKSSVEKIETINDSLLECRGLLYAHGALYASANNSRGLFRLRDLKGTGQFDDITEVLHTEGGTGHGRNHVKLGPDGRLYLIHGDDVIVPPGVTSRCPSNFFGVDQLIPAAWDEAPAKLAQRLPLGHLLRSGDQGRTWEMVCGGLRNPLDIAFNDDGEIFTYDADNERDIGTPWYRPTRVLHLVSGGDYGWRRTSATFPEFRPDNLPPVVNIGVGSPTGIEFGTGSAFTPKYRRALFVCDWSYGRILAVHLTPRGASYSGTSEAFVSGRPLNVTDLAFGPDGAMYFITGGRQTQSGLYRVSYVGQRVEEHTPRVAKLDPLAELRGLRQVFERLHETLDLKMEKEVLTSISPRLGHPDPWIRNAVRIALEWRPVELWREWALRETSTDGALTVLFALSRVSGKEVEPALLARLNQLSTKQLSEEQWLTLLRTYQLTLIRHGEPSKDLAGAVRARLEPKFPSHNYNLNHELVELLVYLKSPLVIESTIPLLVKAETSEELLRYLYCLRVVKDGWTLDQRRAYFTALARADKLQGAREYYRALENIRAEVTASLSASERVALRSLLETKTTALISSTPAKFVKDWKFEELLPPVEQGSRARSFENGKSAFATAQCGACHRVGTEGGVLGPDLTSVASRFGRKEILESIFYPSRVIDDKFRQTTFHLTNGDTLAGTVELEDAEKISLRTSLLSDATTSVLVRDVRERKPSDISPMPEGMLNSLTREQILDLIAFLESGGNPKHSAFKR